MSDAHPLDGTTWIVILTRHQWKRNANGTDSHEPTFTGRHTFDTEVEAREFIAEQAKRETDCDLELHRVVSTFVEKRSVVPTRPL